MHSSKLILTGALLGGALLLSACGGGGSSSTPTVATANTTATITAANGAAVLGSVSGKAYAFASGVSALGTTAATTVRFTGTGASPTFNVDSSQGTATGTTTFGSCIFTVQSSTFPAGSALAVGRVVVINPCSLTVTTAGLQTGSTAYTANSALLLGTVNSSPVAVTVNVNDAGVVSVNGSSIGTVTVGNATGATGGTGGSN